MGEGQTSDEGQPALSVPAAKAAEYKQFALSAALIGDALTELAHSAMMLEVPDPASLGAEGGDWPNIENMGAVLHGWARIITRSLPAPSGLIVIPKGRLDVP